MIISAQVLLFIGFAAVIPPPTLAAARARKTHSACPPFPHVALQNGKITAIGNQKYLFRCDPGYFLASPPQVRCWRGKWSSTKEPTCLRAEGQCEDPDPVDGGQILGEERHEGSVVQYMCKPGFVLMGEGTRSCLRSGHWSGLTPVCMDESEPLQNVAERFKEKFLTDMGSYSSDSVMAQGRLLDTDSLRNGLELVVLIDRSSSIDPEDFKTGIAFVKFLLQEFGVRNGNNPTGTRAAVLAFGTKVDILFSLDNDTITGPQAAGRALDTLKAGGGGTAMQEALMSVFTRVADGLRQQAKKALFLITDGEPNIGDLEDTIRFAKLLRDNADFEIFTVGVGSGINRQLLAKLASEPLVSHVFIMDKYTDLRHIMETISDNSAKPKPVNPARCGYIKHERDYLKHWPWLAAVYVNLPADSVHPRLSLCGGTLICSQWVLTAASCFYYVYENNSTEKVSEKVSQVFVALGERDLIHEDRNQMNFYAEDVVIHPDFQPLDDLEHNLALVRLNVPAPLARFRPACLPDTERPVPLHLDLNTNASIAGWGSPSSEEREATGGTVSLRSSNVSVALEEEGTCDATNGKTTEGRVFCAGGLGTQTCTGDLGSPIIAVDPLTNVHHLIGVLSRRQRCQQGTNQYVQLAKYVHWISDATGGCPTEHLPV